LVPGCAYGGYVAFATIVPARGSMSDNPEAVGASVHAIAGALAAQISNMILYPLDQARFELQVENRAKRPDFRYGETIGVIGDLIAEQGAHAVYRGLGPALVAAGLTNGVYFWVYEGLRYAGSDMVSRSIRLGVARQLLRSLLAAVATVLVTNPWWVVAMRLKLPPEGAGTGTAKGNLAKAKRDNNSLTAVFTHMVAIGRNEGLHVLWHGVVPSLWLTSVPIIQFLAYETLRSMALRGRSKRHPSVLEAFIIGAIAKWIATTVTYPLQVAQTKIRVSAAGPQTTWGCLTVLLRQKGLRGLYLGYEAKLLQTVLQTALTMSLYEKLVEAVVLASS